MPITNPGGNAQMDFIEPMLFADSSAASLTANTAYLLRFRVAEAIPVTKLVYKIAVSSGNVDVGIFTSTDLTNFTLLASSGSTAAAATNAVAEVTLTAGVTLVPKTDYWLAFVTDNTTLTLFRVLLNFTGGSTLGGLKSRFISKASLFPLASFATPAVSANGIWMMAY